MPRSRHKKRSSILPTPYTQHLALIFMPSIFFYPDFIDGLVKNSSVLSYLGQTALNGKNCFHLAGCLPEYNYQIWIQNDPFFLPAKVVMVYKTQKMSPQLEATYNWEINQVYPDAIFDFAIPPNASKTNALSVKK